MSSTVTCGRAQGMLGAVDSQSERREIRRHEIGDRIAAIRTRITDLQQARGSRLVTASSEQLIEAQHHAAASRASAHQALATSIRALLRAADAHERCAISHMRLAIPGDLDEEEHRQEAARHRTAAAADRQRAETVQSLLASRAKKSQDDLRRGTASLAVFPVGAGR